MAKGIFSRDKKRIVPDSSENTQLAIELSESINGSLINVGVLSALLLALAGKSTYYRFVMCYISVLNMKSW